MLNEILFQQWNPNQLLVILLPFPYVCACIHTETRTQCAYLPQSLSTYFFKSVLNNYFYCLYVGGGGMCLWVQVPESPGAAATGACELFNLGVVNTLNHWMLLGFLTLPGAQKLSYTGWSASLRDPPVSASMVLGWSLDSDLPACT